MTDTLHAGAALLADVERIEVEGAAFTYHDFDHRGVPTTYELVDDASAAFWTVNARHRDGSITELCRCESRDRAEGIAAFLEPFVDVTAALEGA